MSKNPKNNDTILYIALILVMVFTSFSTIQPAQALDVDPTSTAPILEPTFSPDPTFEPTLLPEPIDVPPLIPEQGDETAGNYAEADEYYLEPYLSSDGKTLYNAGPVLVLKVDETPDERINKIPAQKGLRTTATFSVDYLPAGSDDLWGKNCLDFPADARTALEYAATLWAATINSIVPITIQACWSDEVKVGTLGYSGGQPYHQEFDDDVESNTWYPGALANAIKGSDLETTKQDMHITFNSTFTWYTGTDANPAATEFDLVTTASHEIAHGLGFAGSARVYLKNTVKLGAFGFTQDGDTLPFIFDTFMEDNLGDLLTDYDSDSEELYQLLTSDSLWWNGPNAMAAYSGFYIPMYAPTTWKKGSSFSHFDFSAFDGTVEDLMVFATQPGEANHPIGPVTKGLLLDIGWNLVKTPAPKLLSPSGTVYTRTPTFKWNTITDATKYKIQLFAGGTKIHEATRTCSASPCSYKPPSLTLNYGAHKWRVMAYANDEWSEFSGYKNFSVTVPIPKPLVPSGEHLSRTPVYEWTGVSGAEFYQILVYRGTTLVTDMTVTAADKCNGTECQTTSSTLLNYADHKWRIRAQDEGLWSAYSADKAFKVLVPTPFPSTPSGNINLSKPTFKWAAYGYVSDYQIQIYKGTATTPVVDKTLTTSACVKGWCSFTPTTALPYASHKWRLRAKAEGVWSTWSAYKNFKTIGPPTLTSPGGNIYTQKPKYVWSPVSGATSYRIQVFQGTTKVHENEVTSGYCNSTSCEYTPASPALTYKAHTWRVQTYINSTWGDYSGAKSFNVINPIPVINAPLSYIYTQTPMYKWTAVTGATKYRFEVYKGASKIFEKTVLSSVCSSGTCSTTPTDSLDYAAHSWRIQIYANNAWQVYGAKESFTVVNTTPILTSPSGNIYVRKPTYTWNEVGGAVRYQVEIYIGTSLQSLYVVESSACSGGVCKKIAPSNLNYNTAYKWRVRAMIDPYYKTWSTYKSFTILNPIPTPTYPTGTIYALQPPFYWTEVTGATSYKFQVYKESELYATVSVDSNVCTNGTCKVYGQVFLDNAYFGYEWRVKANVGSTEYAYSAYKDFTLGYLSSWTKLLISASTLGVNSDSDALEDIDMSPNGRFVAYSSTATNLVEGDTNEREDVFLYDMLSGVTRRVSVAIDGSQANGNSRQPAVSDDGFVVFTSDATNLVAGTTNIHSDIYIHKWLTGHTALISSDPYGVEGNFGSASPAITADGRYITFNSQANNLVEGDTNSSGDVFRFDYLDKEMIIVSQSSSSTLGNNNSWGSSISSDGNRISFTSLASNLVADDTNSVRDVFVRNVTANTTIRVSVDSNGVERYVASEESDISNDGNVVAFSSGALTTDCTGGIFVRNLGTGTVTCVSVDTDGIMANDVSEKPSISADGNLVTFSSLATNLVDGDTNGFADIFVHTIDTGLTERISVSNSGAQSNNWMTFNPVISGYGDYIVFLSRASNLIVGDTDNFVDVYLHVR